MNHAVPLQEDLRKADGERWSTLKYETKTCWLVSFLKQSSVDTLRRDEIAEDNGSNTDQKPKLKSTAELWSGLS